ILSRVFKPEVIQSKVIEKLHEKFKLALAKFEEAQIDEEDTSKAIRKLFESNQELEEGLDSIKGETQLSDKAILEIIT
ncbi:hypothetical protein J6590_106800, partial [Homalodisca vitripennis]